MKIEIQTYGWKKRSEQVLFEDSYSYKWVNKYTHIGGPIHGVSFDNDVKIFDYPNTFIKNVSQRISFTDISFRHLEDWLYNDTFEVKGNFLIDNELIGRYNLIKIEYLWKKNERSFRKDFQKVLKNHNYKITDEEKEELLRPISKALIDWNNQRRKYKEKNMGIPLRVFLNYGNQKEFPYPKLIHEVGFENIAYFQDETFANLYVIEKQQTLFNKFYECYKVLRGDLFNTEITRSSSKRHNLKFENKPKNLERLIKIGEEICEIPEELESSAKIQGLDLSQEIKRLENFLKTQPLVKCS